MFDQYKVESIKSGTRTKRKKGKQPVQRLITDESVPLPSDWPNFMALGANKEDLATFVSNYLIANNPDCQTMVVAGRFHKGAMVKSSDLTLDLSMLEGNHEEADTSHLALHSWYQWLC